MQTISYTQQRERGKQIKFKNVASQFAEFLYKHPAICHVGTVRNVGRFEGFQIQLFDEALFYGELLFQNMCVQAYKSGDKARRSNEQCV